MQSIAASTPEYRKAFTWALVLYAAGIDHIMEHRGNQWLLLVAEAAEEKARREILVYEDENRNWPPPKDEAHQELWVQEATPPTVLFMVALISFFQITGPWTQHSHWFTAGAVHAEKILQHHEWWRIITGLTLHADIVHVVGNTLIGGVFIHFICKMLGSGTGFSLVFLSGILGNAINVLIRGDNHLSVGFSTAVFGAIGLLSGLRIRKGYYKPIILPFGAAFALLAILGAEGERTDLGAHLWGLGVGMILGFLVVRHKKWFQRIITIKIQTMLLVALFAMILASWRIALQS